MKRAVTLFLIVLATLVGLLGLFLVLYEGDAGNEADVYVTIFGAEIDSDLVGAPMIALALAIIIISISALRRAGVR